MKLSPIVISDFFVFDVRLGTKEGTEEEKILYYHPSSAHIDHKVKHVGVCEALINFTRQFSEDDICETVHLENKQWAVRNPEPHLWMVLVVGEGEQSKPSAVEGSVDEEMLQQILRQTHALFKVLYGGIQKCLNINLARARTNLAEFLDKYLPILDLTRDVNLYYTLEGIQFLPVDRNVYLQIQCFINHCEQIFPDIEYSCFLYKDHLVWSGLELGDMRVIYKIFISHFYEEKSPFLPLQSSHKPGFQTGYDTTSFPNVAPKVFLNDHTYYLLVYQMLDITYLFCVDQSSFSDARFYQKANDFMENQINFLARNLSFHYTSKQSASEEYRYLYFNHMNLAMKTSLSEKISVLPLPTINLLNQMHQDFERSPESISEVVVNTLNDDWIVGRKSDQRELYVLFESQNFSNNNIIHIEDKVKKLNSTYFGNIFLD